MKSRYVAILTILLVVADQILKIWVKTHMKLEESISVIGNWFQLKFVENNGAAFGMQLSASASFDWGKLLLTTFRIALVALLIYYIWRCLLRKKGTPTGVVIGLALILAGAIGNILDSVFYGMIFSASTPAAVAHLGDGYAPILMGRVVDMFYFPLFRWESCPSWLSFLVDWQGYFFGPIFNLADAYISVAFVYLLLFQYKFFK